MILYKRDYIVFLLAAGVLFLNLLNVLVNNDQIEDGIKYQALQSELKKTKLENVELRVKIAEKRSLSNIDTEARKQGFVEVKPDDYIILK